MEDKTTVEKTSAALEPEGTLTDTEVEAILHPGRDETPDDFADVTEMLGDDDKPPVKKNKMDPNLVQPAAGEPEPAAEPEETSAETDRERYLKEQLGKEANRRAELEQELEERKIETDPSAERKPMDVDNFMTIITEKAFGDKFWEQAKADEGTATLGVMLHSMAMEFSAAIHELQERVDTRLNEKFAPVEQAGLRTEFGVSAADEKALSKGNEDWLPKKGTRQWYKALAAFKGSQGGVAAPSGERAADPAPSPDPASFVEPTAGAIPQVRAPRKGVAETAIEAARAGDLEKSGRLVEFLLNETAP